MPKLTGEETIGIEYTTEDELVEIADMIILCHGTNVLLSSAMLCNIFLLLQ